jgi:hypothetical protein
MGLEESMVAAPPTLSDDRLDRWRAGFDDMFALIAGRFAQVQSRQRARLYLLGLLSGAERRTPGRSPSNPATSPRTVCSGC